jgi:hypothetical protein
MELDISLYAPRAFKGDTPARRDLIQNRLPRGKVVLLAGAGDVGKSWLLLQLFEAINGDADSRAYGGEVVDKLQPCIVLMGEDDFESIDLRLKAIRAGSRKPVPDHGAIIPVPNVKGPMALISRDIYDQSIKPTKALEWLERQLDAIRAQGSKLGFLAIDTFSTLLPVDANKPEEVQAVMSILAGVATRHDVCVIVTHHMRKDGGKDKSTDGSRASIRGSTAIVDGVRAAYVMEKYSDEDANALRTELDLDCAVEFVRLKLVKNNLGLWSTPITYVRLPDGRLSDVTALLANRASPEDCLWQVIREANQAGRVMQKTGEDHGVHSCRASTWPGGLGSLSRAKLETLVNNLVASGRVQVAGKAGLIAVEKEVEV